MDNVTAIKVENGYALSLAAVLNNGELIPSENERTVFYTDMLNLWSDLMFEWHDNKIGSIKIDLSGQGKETNEITVPDPMWRSILKILNPLACAAIDSTPQDD